MDERKGAPWRSSSFLKHLGHNISTIGITSSCVTLWLYAEKLLVAERCAENFLESDKSYWPIAEDYPSLPCPVASMMDHHSPSDVVAPEINSSDSRYLAEIDSALRGRTQKPCISFCFHLQEKDTHIQRHRCHFSPFRPPCL